VEEEEAGEAELADQLELLVEARAGLPLVTGGEAACPRTRTSGGGLGEPGGSPSSART
jgi:hypothetical protein